MNCWVDCVVASVIVTLFLFLHFKHILFSASFCSRRRQKFIVSYISRLTQKANEVEWISRQSLSVSFFPYFSISVSLFHSFAFIEHERKFTFITWFRESTSHSRLSLLLRAKKNRRRRRLTECGSRAFLFCIPPAFGTSTPLRIIMSSHKLWPMLLHFRKMSENKTPNWSGIDEIQQIVDRLDECSTTNGSKLLLFHFFAVAPQISANFLKCDWSVSHKMKRAVHFCFYMLVRFGKQNRKIVILSHCFAAIVCTGCHVQFFRFLFG